MSGSEGPSKGKLLMQEVVGLKEGKRGPLGYIRGITVCEI